MTVKLLATGVAAAAAIGAAGLVSTTPAVQVAPVVFDSPLPRDPAPNPPPPSDLPTAEELTGILDNLVDPEVSDQVKSGLVAGGLQPHQANVLDRRLRQAGRQGGLPLQFAATNIQSTGPTEVSTDVTVTGPKLAAPISKTITFTNQNGWLLSQDAADELVEGIVGRLPN
jgi:hypothetical protein